MCFSNYKNSNTFCFMRYENEIKVHTFITKLQCIQFISIPYIFCSKIKKIWNLQ